MKTVRFFRRNFDEDGDSVAPPMIGTTVPQRIWNEGYAPPKGVVPRPGRCPFELLATMASHTTILGCLHEPSDSSLLWDAMRLMARPLKAATRLPGGGRTSWRDRRRAAKKLAHAILYTRGSPKPLPLS